MSEMPSSATAVLSLDMWLVLGAFRAGRAPSVRIESGERAGFVVGGSP